jgi:uncharacterized membrane-anchored protein
MLLFICLITVIGLWYWSQGIISVETVSTPKVEALYWAAITFSQTLGTALGDWLADTNGLGYEGGALVFAAGLAAIAGLYFWTNVSRVLLFWAAFILTRPLGTTVGDFLDKPVNHGGLALSRPLASAVIAAFILVCLSVLPQRAGRLDHVVVFGENHLRHLLANYCAYYNGARTHLALNKDTPLHRPVQTVGRIASVTWLGGLHRQYVRLA